MRTKDNKSAQECSRKQNNSKGGKNTNLISQKGKDLYNKKNKDEGLELMSVFGDIYWI